MGLGFRTCNIGVPDMSINLIQGLLEKQPAFQVRLEMKGVNGVSSALQSHIFNFFVESDVFNFSGSNYKLQAFLVGSIRQFSPNAEYMQKFNLTDAQIDNDNKAAIDHMFKGGTTLFAFDLNVAERFFKGEDFQLVCVDRHAPSIPPTLSNEESSLLTSKFLQYAQGIKAAFYSGELPEMKTFQQNFSV